MRAISFGITVMKAILRNAVRLSMKGLETGPHLTRYYMYSRLWSFKQHPTANAKVLSISGSKTICQILGLDVATVVEANYPECSMLDLPFATESFDYVVSDQVLEHVEGNPQNAIDESLRVLKPGGWLVHTTCFINPIHWGPSDLWRFSPQALDLLCKGCKKIIDVDGWGNPYAWILIWLGLRFDGIPHARWHPLNKVARLNDKRWPIVTWIIAEK
jgi:SAM-dependent methyltransferase